MSARAAREPGDSAVAAFDQRAELEEQSWVVARRWKLVIVAAGGEDPARDWPGRSGSRYRPAPRVITGLAGAGWLVMPS